MEKQVIILCAAIHCADLKIYPDQPGNIEFGFVIPGRRHSDCYNLLQILNCDYDVKNLMGRNRQGFLTSDNRYVSRKEAYKIAKEANQLLLPHIQGSEEILTSENLY